MTSPILLIFCDLNFSDRRFVALRLHRLHICNSNAFFRPLSVSRIFSFKNGFLLDDDDDVFLIASAAHSASNGSSRIPVVVSSSSLYVVVERLATLSFVDQLKSWTSKNLSMLPFWWFSLLLRIWSTAADVENPFWPIPIEVSDPLEMPELKNYKNWLKTDAFGLWTFIYISLICVATIIQAPSVWYL